MADHIKIRPANGTWVVRAGGAVIGETARALELNEEGFAPAIYFPRTDVAMAFLDKSETAATDPHKGTATYYNIVAKSGPIADAVWSFEEAREELKEIEGYLSFYPAKVAIEQV